MSGRFDRRRDYGGGTGTGTRLPVDPSPEGSYEPILVTLTFIALLLMGAIAGVGTWRLRQQALDYRDLNHELNTLEEDIADLIVVVFNITVPPNCTVDISNLTQPVEYPDDEFAVFAAGDPTAQIMFNASLISPLTTVLLTIQNSSGVVAYLADVTEQQSVFQDDTFAVQNVVDPTRQVMVNLAGVTAGVTRTWTIQNADGTIAYLTDIPVFPSVFLDDAFTVVNAADNTKEVMLNCSQIDPSSTVVMTVQDFDGTIAYLSDLANGTSPPYADDEFAVFSAADPSARTRLDVSLVSASTLRTMTVQNRSGTIAYLADVLQVVEVFVNTSRSFPDPAFEGVNTLAELGLITHIEISLCGGGGGAGGGSDPGPGGNGGGGSGFENFLILYPASKYEVFNVTLGAGGVGGDEGLMTPGGDGGNTTLTGQSATGFFLELIGYGGGGGDDTNTVPAKCGAGGGGGSSAVGSVVGTAGTQGGLAGGAGGVQAATLSGTRGGFKLPWRSGGGGGFDGGEGAAWQGGFSSPATAGSGAASMFGAGGEGDGAVTTGANCAGGGTAIPNGGDGGEGAALFRYWLQ